MRALRRADARARLDRYIGRRTRCLPGRLDHHRRQGRTLPNQRPDIQGDVRTSRGRVLQQPRRSKGDQVTTKTLSLR